MLTEARYQSPTVRRRRLGMELRQLRESMGFTLEEAGSRLEWSAAKLSRIETAQVRARSRDVADMLDLYGVTQGTRRDGILTLTRESRQRGWWEEYSSAMPDWLESYVGFEAEAAQLRYYEMAVLPGLMQTAGYARAILAAAWEKDDEALVEQRVQLRLARQAILDREQPPQIFVIIDQAVLHRNIGGRAIAEEQLRRVAELARHPAITFRVLPFRQEAHTGIGNSFHIFEFANKSDLPVVYLEHTRGNYWIDDTDDVAAYRRAFDRAQALCLDTLESAALVDTVRRGSFDHLREG